MCGRYTQFHTWEEVHAFYSMFEPILTPPLNMAPRYNIAPTQSVPVLTAGDGGRQIRNMRWGLVPVWANETPKIPHIDARDDKLAESGLWKGPLRNSRAVVIASGWIEWTGPKKDRQPWHFTRADGKPLSFAALWAYNKPLDTTSCSIVTASANDTCGLYHDRMPALLDDDEVAAWLAEPNLDLIRSYQGEIIAAPADRALNKSSTVGGAELLVPDGPVEFPQGGFHD